MLARSWAFNAFCALLDFLGVYNAQCLEGLVFASNYFIILVNFEIYTPCQKSFVICQVSLSVCYRAFRMPSEICQGTSLAGIFKKYIPFKRLSWKQPLLGFN